MLDIIRSLLISFFAVAVLLPVVRYALRKMSPAGHVAALDAAELKLVQKKERKLLIFYYIFACVFAVFSAGALALLSSIVNLGEPETYMHLLTPNFRAMFAPGLLLGLTLAAMPLRLAQSSLLGEDYDLYKKYMRHQEGHNSNKMYNLLLVLMLLLSGAVAWASMQWYVTVYENKVVVSDLLRQERVYDMKDINRIRYLGAEEEYLITFVDQTSVNTAYLKPVQLEMIALLAARSGKRVER